MLWLFRCPGSAPLWPRWSITSSLGLFDNVPVIPLWLFNIRGFRLITRWYHEMRPLWAGAVVHHQGNTTTVIRRGNPWYPCANLNPVFKAAGDAWQVPLLRSLAVSIIHHSCNF